MHKVQQRRPKKCKKRQHGIKLRNKNLLNPVPRILDKRLERLAKKAEPNLRKIIQQNPRQNRVQLNDKNIINRSSI